jgi:streptogramin lyase
MSKSARWVRSVGAAACVLGMCAALASAAGAVQITEFALPAGSKPTNIVAGPDGDLWFTDPGTNQIGRITTAGQVTEFGVGISPAAHLNGIAAGPDGNIWFTERAAHKLGRITPAGTITEFSAGLTNSPDIYGITAGPDGGMWFSETYTSHIGRIDPRTGIIHEFPSPNGIYTSIVSGPDGNLWYTVSGTALVDRMSPTGAVSQFGPLPASDCAAGAPTPCPYPDSIAVGPDGNLWADEARGNAIVRITPLGAISEYTDGLTHGSAVAGLASGPDGNVWFAEAHANQVGRITPAGLVSEFSAGISKGASPYGIAVGPDENLWVTETSGRIARVIPDVPPIVSTGPVASVSSNSAIVTGSVRARGADTRYYVEFGPTPAYGQLTASLDNGAGDSFQPVSLLLQGLQPSVVYHYRLVAVNASGIRYGQDQSLLTEPTAPTVTVGPFAMYFRGVRVDHQHLRLSSIVVIGLGRGESVAYACKRCQGAPRRAGRRVLGGSVTFKTHGLTVTRRSLLRLLVTGTNGSRRMRVYGFDVAMAETKLRRETCSLPNQRSLVPCPGTSRAGGHRARGKARHRRAHRTGARGGT